MKENFSMGWNVERKVFSVEWKWNGKNWPVWNMEKSSSIPFHIMPFPLLKSNKVAYKVNLPVFFFTLKTIRFFILSRDVEAEAVEAVKLLRKRKHFDKRDWNRKRTRKRLILSRAGSRSKKLQRWGSGSERESIKLQEELEAEALKIWLLPHPCSVFNKTIQLNYCIFLINYKTFF